MYNLRIAHIEVRTEDDEDVAPYVHDRQIEVVKCSETKHISVAQILRNEINAAIEEPLSVLRVNQLILCSGANFVNNMIIEEVHRNWDSLVEEHRINSYTAKNLFENLKVLKLLVNGRKVLNEDGIKQLSTFLEKESDKNGQVGCLHRMVLLYK